MEVKSRWKWLVGDSTNLFENKEEIYNSNIQYMLLRTQSMFKWNNLPDTIPQKDLEMMLQVNGNVIITEVEGKLYAFQGGLGGVPNTYYHPTKAIVANPYLRFNKEMEIGEECEVILNDSLYVGLMPLFKKHATLLTECELTLNIAIIDSRVSDLVSAEDESTKKSAELFFENIKNGKYGKVIGTKAFFDGIKTNAYGGTSSSNKVKNLIELHNYLKSIWYIDLGLNANWNGKRESINESESAMNDDVLLPLIDGMLKQRQLGCERVNNKYGTNISVDFSSSWKIQRKEILDSSKILENESQDLEGGEDNETEGNES